MGNSPLEAANKQAAATFFEEIWNQKSESAIDRLVAEDAAGNDPKFGVGRESFKAQWRKWHAGFSDLHFHVEEIIAEGERVVTRWRLTGTHDGQFLGHAPTGRKVDVDGVSIDTIRRFSRRAAGQPSTLAAQPQAPPQQLVQV